MNKIELLQKFLDEELSPDKEKEALHIIADDDELRSAMHFDIFLRKSINAPEFSSTSFEVPDGFTNKVLMQIKQKEETSPQVYHSHFINKISEWIEEFFTPKSFQLRPAFALGLILLLIMLPAVPFYFTQTNYVDSTNEQSFQTQTISEKEDPVMVRFIYVDENAENISIAGDFNNWNPVSLTRKQVNGQEVWTGFVTMPRGENKYMFIVNDDKWVTDPLASMYEDDGFGNKNALIYL
ncbi:MAG: hypothetical protein WD059_01220 [Balneolaceae bacterium]